MFVGHYSAALVAAAHPKAPRLGTLFVAAQLMDLGFFTFVLTDIFNEFYGRRTARQVTYLMAAMVGFTLLLVSAAGAMPFAPPPTSPSPPTACSPAAPAW